MMISVADLAACTGGALAAAAGGADPHGAAVVDGAGIDSRTLRPGQLFVAVEAERDGHEFVAAAAAAGAAAALVGRRVDSRIAQIVVSDTVEALGLVGRLARGRLAGPVVGITGSVGKTSTKDLLAAIFRRVGVTAASDRSWNNELGVPLTLINADSQTERAVVEMGARGSGHIAALCEIARPTVGVVTSVAAAHTEMFGSIDAVAAAKAELVDALGDDGTAVLNMDDERVAAMAGRAAGRVVGYGDHGEVRASGVEVDDLLPRFRLESPWGNAAVRLAVRGAHNVPNALAAAAAAMACGVALDDVVAGLGEAEMSPSRMALHRLAGGGVVIDDAYNANPASMRAALAALAAVEARRRVAVLGLMAELGSDARVEHRAIAAEARAAGIEVIAVGTDLYGVGIVVDLEELASVRGAPAAGEVVLLKGSRVVGLDRVAREWLRSDQRAR